MNFRDFATNYLNPFYLLARICWLWGAFLLAFLAPNISGLRPYSLILYAAALVFVWIGVKPWGRGMSISDIGRKIDTLSKR
jgi:hypothetical protein